MKILMINQADIGGGAEKIALTLSEALNNKDIKCDLIVDYKRSKYNFVYSLRRSKIKKIISKILNKGLNQQSRFCGKNKSLEKKIKDYDLVHIHNLHGNYLNIDIVKYISDLSIPIIWTLHDFWPCTGRCCIDYSCNEWRNECGKCGARLSSYPRMIFDNSKNVLKYKKNIIGNSNIMYISPSIFLSKLILKSYLKDKEIKVINNGIDLSVFKPNNKDLLREKYNLKKYKRYILIIAAKLDNKYKGTDIAIKIINKIQDKSNIGLITVGNGIDPNIINNIEVVNFGYIDNPVKLNEIYSISDIFLNCTLEDNFPTTNLEAMASGTPVFASNIGGNIEQIDSKCGWLFNHNELNTASMLLEKILKSPEELQNKSINGIKKCKSLYDINNMVNEYIKLYENVLLRKK